MSFEQFLRELRDLCNRYLESSRGSENVVAGGTIMKPAASTAAQSGPRDIRESVSAQQIFDSLPDDVTRNLQYEQTADLIVISTKEYIRNWKREWSLVNEVVKEYGGRWVSAGTDSRWEVPLK